MFADAGFSFSAYSSSSSPPGPGYSYSYSPTVFSHPHPDHSSSSAAPAQPPPPPLPLLHQQHQAAAAVATAPDDAATAAMYHHLVSTFSPAILIFAYMHATAPITSASSCASNLLSSPLLHQIVSTPALGWVFFLLFCSIKRKRKRLSF